MTFSSVLIANRGEIARRVVRACRERGLRSIAVYSEADADAAFVHEADHAVLLGPASPKESYLDIARVLAAAKESGADAVHPGYGFLSERAEFARAVTAAGLVFIGPSADVMELMGRKDRAREVAERAGVPVTPQFAPDAVPDDAYPVLVKAAAGGGGKGMHVVPRPADLDQAVATARREAASAFGDDTLIVEPYIEGGRTLRFKSSATSMATSSTSSTATARRSVGTRRSSRRRRHRSSPTRSAPASTRPR